MGILYDLITFALSAVVFFLCIDRLGTTSIRTFWAVRWGLSMLAVSSLAWGSQPFLWPDTSVYFLRLAVAYSTAFYLLSMAPVWKHGPPREVHHKEERRSGGDRRRQDRRVEGAI